MVNATMPPNLQPRVNWHINVAFTIFAHHFAHFCNMFAMSRFGENALNFRPVLQEESYIKTREDKGDREGISHTHPIP